MLLRALRRQGRQWARCVRAFSQKGGNGHESVISIDRSGLYPLHHADDSASTSPTKQPETPMSRHLKSLIMFRGGPITIAEYMSEVLTNPLHGYYTQRDVFGKGGDFITSPEISQMFGEMLGIWAVAMWEQLEKPRSLRLVELGPGRGTLMADLLRGTSPFVRFQTSLSVSLVEVSPVLRRLQWEALGCQGTCNDDVLEARTANDIPVTWHRSLEEIAGDATAPHSLYLAHEFVDALPVHQFQRTERAWCERLVAEAPADSQRHLQMVLSPGLTPGIKTLLPLRLDGMSPAQRANLRAIEICPQGMALAESLAKRVAAHGGAALLIDYGKDGPYEDSLAAIKQHAFVDVLDEPGSADLSARVDFDALRWAVRRSGAASSLYGPITQAELLKGLGIEVRLRSLLETATDEQADALMTGYSRLVGARRSAGNKRHKGAQMGSQRKGGERAFRGERKGSAKAYREGGVIEVEGMGESYLAACIAPSRAPRPLIF